jgi:transcriptional regulator with XRE-family HTH domain
MSEIQASGPPGNLEPGERPERPGPNPLLAELSALAGISPQTLSPISGQVPPEARDFAETLRVLFGALGMSLNRLAAVVHSDPGTVSRYLSGKRIPPPDFIDSLCKAVYDARGSLITPQVQDVVHEQFLAALREHSPARYEVQRLTDLLHVAAQEKRQHQVTVSALEEAIASRNDRIYALELESRQLQAAGGRNEQLLEDERRQRAQLQETLNDLYRQVSNIKEQLNLAQRRAAGAEDRCREVERRLEAAGAQLPDETQPAVAHWAAAGLAAGPNWWDRYSGLFPDWFGPYMSMEQAAQSMWIYEQQFIPGLLQTEKYTAAVVSLGNCTPEQATQRVEVRQERQRRFRDGKMKLRVILDEGALRRTVTATEAHLEQLRYLRTASESPRLTLEILPLHSGALVSPNSFAILKFAEDSMPDVAYVESLTQALYLEQEDDVQSYLLAMEGLSTRTYDRQKTQDIIDQAITQLET